VAWGGLGRLVVGWGWGGGVLGVGVGLACVVGGLGVVGFGFWGVFVGGWVTLHRKVVALRADMNHNCEHR